MKLAFLVRAIGILYLATMVFIAISISVRNMKRPEYSNVKIAVLVNSNVNNSAAQTKLLKSFFAIPNHKEVDLVLIEGGGSTSPGYVLQKRTPYVHIVAPHNSIDFTGLITLVDLGVRVETMNPQRFVEDVPISISCRLI